MPPSPTRTLTPKPTQTVAVTRLRFLAAAPAGANVRRSFTQPRPAVAVEERVEPADLPATAPWPDPTDHCNVVLLAASDLPPRVAAWIAPPERPDAVPPVTVERDGVTVQWRPSQAVVCGAASAQDDALAALTDFAFYEGELRALEAAVAAHETQAQADVALAHRPRDRKHWPRFQRTIERLSQMRLTFARLEPLLAGGSRTLPPEVRRIVSRLIRKADVEARLEALNDRLETLEDLYGGANDRVADYRGWHTGHLLEIGIIVLLLIEGAVMSSELVLHYREFQRDKATAAATMLVPTEDLSEEFRATITKVADGKVTFTRTVFNRETKKIQKSEELTLPAGDPVLVVRGTLDRDGREVEAGDPIPGGLKNERFAKIPETGLRAVLITDAENKKIVEIYLLSLIRRP
jgi:hypothetical protein